MLDESLLESLFYLINFFFVIKAGKKIVLVCKLEFTLLVEVAEKLLSSDILLKNYSTLFLQQFFWNFGFLNFYSRFRWR